MSRHHRPEPDEDVVDPPTGPLGLPPAPPPVPPSPGSWPTVAPAPPRRGPGGLVVGTIALLVVLLVGLGVGLVRPDLLGLPPGSPSVAAGEPVPGIDVDGTATEVAPASGATTATDPTAELRRLARSDDAALDAVTGAWVPQLSSKRPGLVDAGRTWDAAAILAEHEELRARYPQARLLWSGEWPVFGGSDYWVTVLATPSSSAGGANGWCDRQDLGADDCFAKRLARSGGSEGTAVHR